MIISVGTSGYKACGTERKHRLARPRVCFLRTAAGRRARRAWYTNIAPGSAGMTRTRCCDVPGNLADEDHDSGWSDEQDTPRPMQAGVPAVLAGEWPMIGAWEPQLPEHLYRELAVSDDQEEPQRVFGVPLGSAKPVIVADEEQRVLGMPVRWFQPISGDASRSLARLIKAGAALVRKSR